MFVFKEGDHSFYPKFTIGVQTFGLRECGDEEHASWYLDMLEKALKNLHTEVEFIRKPTTDKY